MKKALLITFFVLFVIAAVMELFYYNNFVRKSAILPPVSVESNDKNDNVAVAAVENQNSNTTAANQNSNAAIVTTASVVPPMDNFLGRITLNPFGNEPSKMNLSADQYSDLSCPGGKNYAGYHTGDDLETTPAERNTPVSVYSIANGTVRQASTVNGYGGLIVIEYEINGVTYTAYYGHVDLKTVTVKAGSKVKMGQKIAELAPGCSAANGNTRKHLHFGMHKGSAVVVSGYVTDKNSLSNWVDARDIIK